MEAGIKIGKKHLRETSGRKFHVAHNTEPFFLMEEELLFKAVDDRKSDEVFFADAAHGQMPGKVVAQDLEDHGKGIRQVGNDKIRQECMGLTAGTLHAGDSQAEYFRLSVGEGDKAARIAPSSTAGSFRTTVRADFHKQGVLFQTLPEKLPDMEERIFQLAMKGV